MGVKSTNGSFKVLNVDLSKRYGGATVRCLDVLGGMSLEEVGFAGLDGSPATRHATAAGIRVHGVGTMRGDPRVATRLTRIARQEGFDLIDTQNVQSKLWGSLAAGRAGTALVSTLNSWYLDEHGGSLKGRVYQLIENATNRRVDLFIAVSEPIRDRLLEQGVSGEKIVVIPGAVSIDRDAIAVDPVAVRGDLGLSPDARIVCATGRLVEAKGYEHLIDAMARLCGTHPKLQVLILGEGHLDTALKRQIRDSGLADRVRLLGFRERSEVLRLVKAADLFVMSSVSEGTPVALLEAGALDKPIVATCVGGIPDVLRDGEHGRLVEPAEPEALARALMEMLEDPAAAEQMGRRAGDRVRSEFGLAAQVAATRRAYEKARNHARRRKAVRSPG